MRKWYVDCSASDINIVTLETDSKKDAPDRSVEVKMNPDFRRTYVYVLFMWSHTSFIRITVA
jgi:hypothetical protein